MIDWLTCYATNALTNNWCQVLYAESDNAMYNGNYICIDRNWHIFYINWLTAGTSALNCSERIKQK